MSRFEFRPARPDDADEVAAFNARMAAAGQPHRLSVGQPFETVRLEADSPLALSRYLCLVDDRVRGGVSVKTMRFRLQGQEAEVSFYGYPLSEGIIDPDFSMVGLMIHKEVARRYPLLYGLGVGSTDAAVARLMIGTGWSCTPVPFHFAVLRAGRFLRNFAYLRERRSVRALADLLAISGLGAVGLGALRLAQGLAGRRPDVRGLNSAPFETWGDWADDVWARVRDRYSLIGDRSTAALRALYPADHPQMRKVQVSGADGRGLGWVVYSAERVRGHKYFGDMILAALIDMLAAPEDAYAVTSAALSAVSRTAADVVVVNQANASWSPALRHAGLLSYGTNMFLFLSPGLKKRFQPLEASTPGFFFTRGDGDGPVHLW